MIERQAAISVAGNLFPNYVVMLSFILEEQKDLKRLRKKIAELGKSNYQYMPFLE
jgi:hypothetical protein